MNDANQDYCNVEPLSIIDEEIDDLFKARRALKENSWCLHIPLPRVIQIMSAILLVKSSDLEEKGDMISFLLQAGSDIPSEATNAFLLSIPSHSRVWDLLAEQLQSKKTLNSKILVQIFRRRPEIFEEIILNILRSLTKIYCEPISSFSCPGVWSFLEHKCCAPIFDSLKKNYFFVSKIKEALLIDKELAMNTMCLISTFLQRCNFSPVSVKVSQCLTKQIYTEQSFAKAFSSDSSYFSANLSSDSSYLSSDSSYLPSLIYYPPCITCNPLTKSKNQLEALQEHILRKLNNVLGEKNDKYLRILLCCSEWIFPFKNSSAVRTLFVPNRR